MARSKPKSRNRDAAVNLRFTVTPPSSDELVLGQTVQNAMEKTFGLTRAFTYFDFVHPGDEGGMVIQVATLDAPYFKAALAAFSGAKKFALTEELSVLQTVSDE